MTITSKEPEMNQVVRTLMVLVALLSWAATIPAEEQEADLNLYFNPEDLEPEIQTKRYDNRTEKEFRLNEHLYMIKTIPDTGSPYYLVDPYGSGEWEYRRNMSVLEMNVPDWVLLKW